GSEQTRGCILVGQVRGDPHGTAGADAGQLLGRRGYRVDGARREDDVGAVPHELLGSGATEAAGRSGEEVGAASESKIHPLIVSAATTRRARWGGGAPPGVFGGV